MGVKIVIFYFVGLLCYGCYMCYKSKGLPSEFNESASIAQINYFAFTFGALILVIQFIIPENIMALATVRAFGLILGHTTILLLLNGPKLSAIKSGNGNARKRADAESVIGTAQSSTSAKISGRTGNT